MQIKLAGKKKYVTSNKFANCERQDLIELARIVFDGEDCDIVFDPEKARYWAVTGMDNPTCECVQVHLEAQWNELNEFQKMDAWQQIDSSENPSDYVYKILSPSTVVPVC